MSKLAFSFRKKTDEWNPHIVRYVRSKIPTRFAYDVNADKEFVKNRDERFQEWQKKWEQAQGILNTAKPLGIYPLAYRLEPNLSKVLKSDPVIGSKFGGFPDFRAEFLWPGNKGKKQFEILSRVWPGCGGCNRPMIFLGSFDLSEWLMPIHYMTANQPTRTSYGSKLSESDLPYHQHSGLGFGHRLGIERSSLIRLVWDVYYCKEPHFDIPASDSRIIMWHKYTTHEGAKDKLMDLDAYKKLMKDFTKQNKIKSNIPIQKIEGLELKFDVDVPGEEFVPDWIEEVTEKHPEIFGRDADYQFFGHPRSQQTEKRPFCQNSYLEAHRMAPIVNWTDNDEDLTYQIYGCLRCHEDKVYCKTDGSCT